MSLVSTNKIDATKYELEIKVDAEGFEKAVQTAYMKARKRISVNGFRKGKAPRKMIEQIYGENVFYEDAVNSLVNTDVAPALEETDYELVASPEISVTSINKADGVNFKVTITVKPEVEISDYKGIEVEKVVNAVTDEDIDKQIQALRERNGRLVTVDDRAAENGDIAVIDFEGFKDGVPFDGGKDENYELALGSNTFIPGFEEQIVGRKTGEEFTINVTFPEKYQMEEIAGQLCEFKIRLNEIKSKELPDLDDEFVKDATEFDTLDELKDDMRKKLEEAAAANADIDTENRIYETLIDKMTADIPEVMYENKIDEMVKDFEVRLSQNGLTMETYLMYTNIDMPSFRKTFEEQAQKQVKVRLALEKIAELENVEITDEQVDEEINRIAEQYSLTPAKVRSIISDKSVKQDLAVAEASKIVKDSAKING
ncbi:MAG: trigger factor [Ruminococcus sp.]|nr:trigger factor [Ruminococcus sp.]MCM1380884.1 trigger factor [Muribaculaceae bacterium]MCM1478586.1 trigger factor [Muribaculaceae bacterium]